MKTVGFVPHHLHCKCIWRGTSIGGYEEEDDYSEENLSMFIWVPDNCFKTYLKNCEPIL